MSRSARALAMLACAALAGSGCGADPEPGGEAEGERASLGSRPGKLTCEDWRQGTDAERRGTIHQLTLNAEGNANPDDEGPNRAIDPDRAYEVFDGWCSKRLARGFLLYDLYNRAAVFSGEPGT